MIKHQRQTNRVSVWIRRICLVLAGLLIGINIYLVNARGIGRNQMPMPFGYGFANVLSGSMEPTFSRGTLLLVKQKKEPEVGDIAVYQTENQLVVHRIIHIDDDTVTTQGDANDVADAPVPRTEIKGVVTGWIPHLGAILSWLRTPMGIVVILICAFLLVEGSFRREREDDDRELEAIKEEIRRLKEEKEKS